MRNWILRDVYKTPAMGIYLGSRTTGVIAVGDDVSIPASESTAHYLK